MLQMQLTSEVDKYLQKAAERCEMNVNYFDGQHVATNTISHQQKVDSIEPATLSPSPLAYEKPIHSAEKPCITTHTELPIDNTNKSTPDDKYPWLDPDEVRRNMTDKEILQMKLNLKDSILNEKKRRISDKGRTIYRCF